jgi:hypothetical protein
MMRLIAIPVGVLVLLLAAASPAEANMWDWINELSGPGPSHGRGNGLITVCAPGRAAEWKRPCGFFDLRRFETESEDNFPNDVSFVVYDGGLTWKLWRRAFEVGFGGGAMRFTSDDRITNSGDDVTTTKFIFTIPRVVAVPGAAFFERIDSDWGARFARVFKVYARVNIIPGTMDATDFGVRLGSGPDESTFRAGTHGVPSVGWILDLGELLPQ